MITSKQNALIKEIRSLSDKKFRDSLNLYVAEGVKAVRDAVELNLPIKVILGTEKALSALGQLPYRTETCDEIVYKSVSNEVSPQGVLAVIEKPKNELAKPSGSCIFLDGVADPSNVGAVLRTAVASGYKDVYMTEECADPFSHKCVRSSMGGVFRANIVRGQMDELLKFIPYPIVVADMGGENVFNANVENDFCLVIGNEGHGVSTLLRQRADFTVSIPMENGMESLNAAVSAGILMYNLKKHH